MIIFLCCRRLCPDISFFQIATKYPNKKVTTGECEKLSCCLVKLGSVVQKPVNTNPGSKVSQSIYFSCTLKCSSLHIFCVAWYYSNWKLYDKQYEQKVTNKTGIKILAKLGLGLLGFEQPSPGFSFSSI